MHSREENAPFGISVSSLVWFSNRSEHVDIFNKYFVGVVAAATLGLKQRVSGLHNFSSQTGYEIYFLVQHSYPHPVTWAFSPEGKTERMTKYIFNSL